MTDTTWNWTLDEDRLKEAIRFHKNEEAKQKKQKKKGFQCSR